MYATNNHSIKVFLNRILYLFNAYAAKNAITIDSIIPKNVINKELKNVSLKNSLFIVFI